MKYLPRKFLLWNISVSILGFSSIMRRATTATLPGKHRGRELY